MKNFKEKFRKIENWKGWKWGYCFEVLLVVIFSISCLASIAYFCFYPHSGKVASSDVVVLSVLNLVACTGSYFLSKVLGIKYFYKFLFIPLMYVFLIILESEILSFFFLHKESIFFN